MKENLSRNKFLFDFDCDLVSDIVKERLALTDAREWDHLPGFSGKERSKKISEVREEMKKSGIDFHLLTSPDDIMWLLNIRGNDLPYSPLIFSFAIIGEVQILLFVGEDRFPHELASEFDRLGIIMPVSYTHLRAHETVLDLVCR